MAPERARTIRRNLNDVVNGFLRLVWGAVLSPSAFPSRARGTSCSS